MTFLEQSGDPQLRTLVEAELAATRAPREWPKELRARWISERNEKACPLLTQMVLVGCVLTLGGALVDLVAVPAVAGLNTLIRLAVLVPLTIFALVCLRKGKMGPAKLASAIMCIFFAATAVWASGFGGSDVIARFSMATILLLVAAIMLMPFSLREKYRFTAAYCAAVFIAAVFPHQLIPFEAVIQHVVLTLMGAAGALTVAQRIWRSEARDALHSWREQFLREDLERSNDILRELSESDPLTGLANRRNFERVYNDFLEHRGPSAPLAVMMIDLDHFKAHNDRFGHQSGDRCLVKVARVLAETMDRHGGHVARYGGEEFVAVVPGSQSNDGAEIAEEVRSNLEALCVTSDGNRTHSVTASIGVATDNEMPPLVEMIARADEALYRAKQLGRNRVERAKRANERLPSASEPLAGDGNTVAYF